jgi:hypothetical protein
VGSKDVAVINKPISSLKNKVTIGSEQSEEKKKKIICTQNVVFNR